MPSGVGTSSSTHPVRACIAELTAVLDRVPTEADRSTLSPNEVAATVTELDRVLRRVQALKLAVVATPAADVAAEDAGFVDTGAWLARQTRATGDDAARQVRLAEGLRAAPRTGEALSAGEISDQHARVITGALGQLPDRLTPAERDQIEASLVERAQRVDPARLRKLARRAVEAVEPDPVVVDAHENQLLEREEERAWAKARLSFHDNGDGTTTMHAVVPTLAADITRKIINTLTAPRRTGTPGAEITDWAHRRGVAFAELLEHLPTDQLHPKTAATVVVQLRHDVLLGALAAAGLDTDHPISAATARRLACGAGIIPAILGGASLSLDLGRQARCHTDAQRVALATVHTHCAAEGCTIPFAWCEIHHRQPWSKGGPTDLANAVPLCGFHHRQLHRDNGPRPPLIEPEQRQRPQRRNHSPRTHLPRIPQQRRAPART